MNDMTKNDRTSTELVEAWGDLGVLWGIPRTTARIQALLLASDGPLSLDEIATTLGVSKGGASTRLAELRRWGIARRVPREGDRRDYHAASDDVWGSFLTMVRARKREEFDPVAERIRAAISARSGGEGGRVADRLALAEEILDTLDGLGERFLGAGRGMRAVLRFLARRSKKETAK
jgi:DNA-binding transcriptional regulator GbsR (MarR family)